MRYSSGSHVYFDISWDEVAKYFVATLESTRIAADLINLYRDRFLFGTDEVAPADSTAYTRVYKQYAPLWKSLDPETSRKVRLTNYQRLFDQARSKVRAREAQHLTPYTLHLTHQATTSELRNAIRNPRFFLARNRGEQRHIYLRPAARRCGYQGDRRLRSAPSAGRIGSLRKIKFRNPGALRRNSCGVRNRERLC
jgi:hypothetical protein